MSRFTDCQTGLVQTNSSPFVIGSLGALESAKGVQESSRIQHLDALAYVEEWRVHLRCSSKTPSILFTLQLKETLRISDISCSISSASSSRSPIHSLGYTRDLLFGKPLEYGIERQSVWLRLASRLLKRMNKAAHTESAM